MPAAVRPASSLLTPLLVPVRDRLGLAEIALLYLVPVMAAAAIGGLWPALLAALAADLLVNFFFVPPYHTLLVTSQNHVIVLIIYLLVAASFSVTVDLAARQRARPPAATLRPACWPKPPPAPSPRTP